MMTTKKEEKDMKSMELREKLHKAEEKVEKTRKTIERHLARADKKKALAEKNGWSLDSWENKGNNEAWWNACDYHSALEDAKGAEKKLEEAIKTADNWRAKLERQLELEKTIQTEIPEAFKEAKEELVKRWVECDIEERERIKKLRKELDHKDLRKLVTYSHEMEYQRTDEEFQKIEEREAELWLIDLYNRVYAITGKITDASGIHWGGKCLDGIIKGENGTARVETIGAGGYNIVRYHLRVLVHEYKREA